MAEAVHRSGGRWNVLLWGRNSSVIAGARKDRVKLPRNEMSGITSSSEPATTDGSSKGESAERMPAVVNLKPRHALPFFKHHPWVFAGAIRTVRGNPQAGDAVTLYSNEGEFVAHGLFNPHSQIRVRLYSWDEQVPVDREFWKTRIQSALQLRSTLFGAGSDVTACQFE